MFLDELKVLAPSTSVLLSAKTGEHNFDTSLTMEEAWIRDGCDFLSTHW